MQICQINSSFLTGAAKLGIGKPSVTAYAVPPSPQGEGFGFVLFYQITAIYARKDPADISAGSATVIWGIDYLGLNRDYDYQSYESYPTYLYDNNPLNDV